MQRPPMMLYCLLSALLGGLVVLIGQSGGIAPQPATAQEPVPPRLGRGLFAPPPKVQPPAPPAEQRPIVPAPLLVAPPRVVDGVPRDEDGLTAEERVNVTVYENCNRSVVNINTKGVREATLFLIDIPTEGSGSGSVLDKQGHILTNSHVVEDAREIEVTLFDGSSHRATVVGQDSASDIAVIRVEAPAELLYPVSLADSAQLKVGQRVFAIGNPFGLERTLTTGIISSLNRSIPSRNGRSMKSIIQIDAAINPGNSGGPLLDSQGRLIGMNTAIASKTGQNAGVGFAVPASNISRVIPQLITRGRVTRPDVGIAVVFQTEQGLQVARLTPKGPAEVAGLLGPRVVRERRRQGPFIAEYETIDRSVADLIVGVDGKKITSADQFLSEIETKKPGDLVTLNVIRAGQAIDVPVRLGESPN